jgi:putative ABC transport system substrate-binding protein
MDRRRFLATVAGGLLTAPLAAEAQQAGKTPHIGILWTGAPAGASHLLEAFRKGLRALGYVEDQTIVLEQRYGMGMADRLSGLAAELVDAGVVVLVTAGPYGSLAAKQTTKTVPVVFVGANSPVELGLVASIARPGGNVTGVAWNVDPGIQVKQLELLREAVPRLGRVAFLTGIADSPDSLAFIAAMKAGARYLGLKLQVVSIRKPEEYDAAFRAVTTERVDALVVAGNSRNFVYRKRVLDFAARNRLPAAYGWREAVQEGGLLSYGPDVPDLFRRAAVYVDKILKGAQPADLPVEQPTMFELVINLKTATTLGLTIPPSLLQRADQVIE